MNPITPDKRAEYIALLLAWERGYYLDGNDKQAEWCRAEARNLGWEQPHNYTEPLHTPNEVVPAEKRTLKKKRWRKGKDTDINRLLQSTVQTIALQS